MATTAKQKTKGKRMNAKHIEQKIQRMKEHARKIETDRDLQARLDDAGFPWGQEVSMIEFHIDRLEKILRWLRLAEQAASQLTAAIEAVPQYRDITKACDLFQRDLDDLSELVNVHTSHDLIVLTDKP